MRFQGPNYVVAKVTSKGGIVIEDSNYPIDSLCRLVGIVYPCIETYNWISNNSDKEGTEIYDLTKTALEYHSSLQSSSAA